MKSITKIALLAVGLTVSLSGLQAQEERPGRPPGDRPQPPVPPIIAALDLNKNGVIEAEEIAQASESLAKLDKNGDGKLTRDELMPGRPPGGRPERPGGPGRPGGGEGGNERGPRRDRGNQ